MRRRRKSHLGLWISLIVIGIVIVFGLIFWKIYSIKNSSEFNLSSISVYFLINSDEEGNSESQESGYFIVVDGSKRSVYAINVKNHLYNSEIKQEISFDNPKLSESLLADMLGIKPIYDYYVVYSKSSFDKFVSSLGLNVNNFEDLFNQLSQRGLKIFDYFKLSGIVKKLRPDTTLTSEGLAKLLYSFGNYSVRMLDLTTMTENPLKITVLNKTFERLYIDLDKLKQLKEEIRR